MIHSFNPGANPFTAPEIFRSYVPSVDVQKFAANTGARIIFNRPGNPSFCHLEDRITMPDARSFPDQESYQADLLHELVHWTGHRNRLGRRVGPSFGRAGYAYEEIIAEIGSIFLCADLGVSQLPREESLDYIDSFHAALRWDRRLLKQAADEAQAACDYLHSLQARQKRFA